MGFGSVERCGDAQFHRDLKPSRMGFSFQAVLVALAMNLLWVAAKKTDNT
jgi:hypothetical protein